MSAQPCTIEPRAAELLGEAADWRLIGLLFERPREGWKKTVAELAAACTDPLLREAGELAREAEEGRYLAFLGPGGALSPRESGYRRTADPARTLSEIRIFHAAFAFEPEREDPVDHMSVLCAFVGWMRLKEAYAVADDDRESAEITRAAADRFVREHLAPCAGPLAERLEQFECGQLLPAARALLARAGARPKNFEGDWVPEGLGVEDCSMSCGLAGGSGEEPEGEQELPPEFTAGLPRDL
ncbi:MAG: molecular chaperone TorD family protein [Planctomycetes bacterium]|nr:molecular chaperone TorD family protein [Planctomycetota bacterium]